MSARRKSWTGAQRDVLASNEGDDAGEVAGGGETLVPHPDKKLGSEVVHFVEVEQERLKGS